jgi:hypothetical protein
MWIFLNNAAYSIVQWPDDHRLLKVRSRIEGDIEKNFPKYEVKVFPNNDYRFSALVPKRVVAEVMAKLIRGITYGNFKGSIPNDKAGNERHNLYLSIWSKFKDHQDRKYPRRYQYQTLPFGKIDPYYFGQDDAEIAAEYYGDEFEEENEYGGDLANDEPLFDFPPLKDDILP